MSELSEQISIFDWAEWYGLKDPRVKLLAHIPNEGKRSPKTGALLKRSGMKPGFPDMILPVPIDKYHGLFIELKDGKKKPNDNQTVWLTELSRQGYMCYVAYSGMAAINLIIDYLDGTEPTEQNCRRYTDEDC